MATTLPLLLGSKSPRRQALLNKAGIAYELVAKEVEETFPPGLPPERVSQYLAELKSRAYLEEAKRGVVITADTVVVLGDRLIGKPASDEEAREMLQALSGSTHTVVSGVCLRYRGRWTSFREFTDVEFRELKPREIDHYLNTYDPKDRAGSYGVQDYIGLRGVTHIAGDYYNVMGLPVCRLVAELEEFLPEHSF